MKWTENKARKQRRILRAIITSRGELPNGITNDKYMRRALQIIKDYRQRK